MDSESGASFGYRADEIRDSFGFQSALAAAVLSSHTIDELDSQRIFLLSPKTQSPLPRSHRSTSRTE